MALKGLTSVLPEILFLDSEVLFSIFRNIKNVGLKGHLGSNVHVKLKLKSYGLLRFIPTHVVKETYNTNLPHVEGEIK